MTNKERFNSGFTLIEVLIVLAVLVITAGGVVVWERKSQPTPTPTPTPTFTTPTPSFQKELKKEPEMEEKSVVQASVSDLINNPAAYIDKTVQIMATVKCIDKVSGRTDWVGNGDYFLEDNSYRIKVFTWAPIHVAQCVLPKECPEPLTMVRYIEKKVKLNGVFRELPKERSI